MVFMEGNIVFKFNNFPELQIFHEKYLNHEYSTTKALIDVVDKKIKGAQERFARKMSLEEKFLLIYERKIFEELVKYKPNIINLRTNTHNLWDDFIGSSFDNLPEKKKFLMVLLVEESGGVFRLPPDYYE